MTKCNDLVNVWGGGLEKKINVKFKEKNKWVFYFLRDDCCCHFL